MTIGKWRRSRRSSCSFAQSRSVTVAGRRGAAETLKKAGFYAMQRRTALGPLGAASVRSVMSRAQRLHERKTKVGRGWSLCMPQFLTKHENSRKYFIRRSGTSAFNLRYSIKAQLREIIMINFTFSIPVKTRLPSGAWMLAAIATLFSLVSSLLHSPTPADNALYAAMIWRLVWPS